MAGYIQHNKWTKLILRSERENEPFSAAMAAATYIQVEDIYQTHIASRCNTQTPKYDLFILVF